MKAVAMVDITKKEARITIGMGNYISATSGAKRAVDAAANIQIPIAVDTTLVGVIMISVMDPPDTDILAPNLAKFMYRDVWSSVEV